MDINDLKVRDASEYLGAVEAFVNVVVAHVTHVATCSEEGHCYDRLEEDLTEALTHHMVMHDLEVFWTLPRSMAWVSVKQAVDEAVRIIESTQQEVPR